jgi:hypothetical protein
MSNLARMDVDKPGRERLRYRELRRMYEEIADKLREANQQIQMFYAQLDLAMNRVEACERLVKDAWDVARCAQNDVLAMAGSEDMTAAVPKQSQE